MSHLVPLDNTIEMAYNGRLVKGLAIMTTPDIAGLIRNGYEATPDTQWPTYDGKFLDRTKYMTASQAGNCERWIYFDKHDVPAEGIPEGWGRFERGHSGEAWMVKMLRAADTDWRFSYLGEDQVSFHLGSQSGTPDGLAWCQEHGYVLLEFKTIHPQTNIRYLPKPNHKLQVQQNIDLVEQCLGIEIPLGLLFYLDAEDFSKSYTYVVERDEDIMQELEDKADKIMKASNANELEPEGIYNGGCKFCPYGAQCSDAIELREEENKEAKGRRKLADEMFK